MSNRTKSRSDTRYIYSTLDTSPSLFRYWGALPRSVMEMLRYRHPQGWYLTEGFTREAMTEIEITDQEGEVAHDDDTDEGYDAKRADVVEKYIKARAARKAFGFSLLTYISFTSTENRPDDPVMYWIEDNNITEVDIKQGTKEVLGLKFTPPNYLGYTSAQPIEVTGKQLEDVRLLGDYDATIGYFRSYLEPIADDLIALSNLSQQSAILMIRIGSGIRYIQAPKSMLQDSGTRTELINFLENMGINSLLIVPDGMAGNDEFKFEIKFGEGTPPDFTVHRDIHLENISAYTGIPREVFIGSELGLRSAETNRQSFLNQLAREQKESVDDLLWMFSKVLDCEQCASGEHTIRFRPLVELDETEQLELIMKKIELLHKVDPAILKALDPDQLVDMIDLGIEFDASKYEEAKRENELMQQAINNAANNEEDNGDTDEGGSLPDQSGSDPEEEA